MSYLQIFERYNIDVQGHKLTGVTDQLQRATASDIVFYRLTGDERSQQTFEKRLKETKAAFVFINSNWRGQDSRVHELAEKNYSLMMEELLDEFYPVKEIKVKLIGVTGTNGKSTVVHLLNQIFNKQGKHSASLGTLGLVDENGVVLEDLQLTTPSKFDLRRICFQYKKLDYLFIEVSSHALAQERIGKLRLSRSIWTNWTQDHLDYHKTMDNYFQAKKKIFEFTEGEVVVSEKEKSLIERLQAERKLHLAPSLKIEALELPVGFKLEYNQRNLEVALEIARLELSSPNLMVGEHLQLPPGRVEAVPRKEGWAFIDYAHTPDAMDNVCKSLKESFPDRELTVVFGCGGNRDKQKRPMMRIAAERYADHLIITSDNPRDEDPSAIIRDILGGEHHDSEVDRKTAIKKALIKTGPKGIILVAGKGHESYQEVNGVRHPFSDREVLQELIKEESSHG